MKIHNISAREILDSRGNPTISATVELEDGTMAEAAVPSGASTGSSEDVELRDEDKKRFGGLGELKAVSNVNSIIAPALVGMEAIDQAGVDQAMIALDGTDNKANLGANAILAVSLAVSRAQSHSLGIELFEYLGLLFSGQQKDKYSLPTPMFNIINGGAHAQNNLDIQEMMIVPMGLKTFEEKLRAGSEIYHLLKQELTASGDATGLGDEGGFAPDFKDNESGIERVQKAIKDSGCPESKVRISLDVAATEFWDAKKKRYLMESKKKALSSGDLIKILSGWAKTYNLLSIEDGLSEDDSAWSLMTAQIFPVLTIGDDLFTTNPDKIAEGIENKQATGVIIKPNQIGTLSETLESIRRAQAGGLKIIVSHRSGETEDSFIADLAVAVGAEFIKSGAPARSERLAKYNRLTAIEDYLAQNYN